MSNLQVWFVGDWHFGHKNILGFQDRPFNTIDHMNNSLVELHNSVVKPKDIVWVLGDVAFGRDNLKYVARMNGKKRLVLGNHDTYKISEYQGVGFERLFGMVSYKEFVLTHAPIHPSQLEFRYNFNIHGHMHNADVDDPRYYNCCIDRLNSYTPVNLDTIRRQCRNVVMSV